MVATSSTFGSGYSFVPDPDSPMSSVDQEIDPISGDYVRTSTGEWSEVVDSRTTMLLMIALEHGASPFDPADGTTIAEKMRNGDPVTPEDVREETLRVGEVLRAAGRISDFRVDVHDSDGSILRDQAGRLLVRTSFTDLASGSTVDLIHRTG
jgi:hypothetical protein